MSWFGHGTFKQDVLDDIENQIEHYGGSRLEAVAELGEVMSHLISTAMNRDEALEEVRKRAYEEARADLIKRIK